MWLKCISIILLAGCLLSEDVRGEEGRCVDEIMRDIRLLNLINGLDLSKKQTELIIQKAEEAERIREEFKNGNKDKKEDIAQVLENLRDVLIQGKESSPALKRQVHKSKEMMHEIRKNYEESITELAVSIKKELYAYQLYTLDKYVPCLILPEGSAAGAAEDSKGAERLLIRVRNIPAQGFEKRKEELVQKMIERIRRSLPKGFIIEEEEEKERILSVLEEARNLSDVDFTLKKTELVQELKSKYSRPDLPIDISVKIERLLLTSEIIPLLNVR